MLCSKYTVTIVQYLNNAQLYGFIPRLYGNNVALKSCWFRCFYYETKRVTDILLSKLQILAPPSYALVKYFIIPGRFLNKM